MIRKNFVNRSDELNFLERRYKSRGFEFVIISGRRRTGKSRLMEEFVKNKENITLLCENRKFAYNLDKFNSAISGYFNIPKTNFSSFRDCFEFIIKNYKKSEKLVVGIDEFSYLVKKSEIIAEMQGVVDEILKDKNVLLLLTGSAVSLMQKHLLSYTSPLYGRTTGSIYLQPLHFKHLFKWFPDSGFEYLLKIYTCCDGIPKYLEFFSGKNAEKEIIENFFNPNAFLFREMKQLLSEELREEETYIQIFEAISSGHNKVTEIANYSYMNAKDISAYLNILMNIGLIRKDFSLLEKKKKRGLYFVKDSYTKFWFNFVSRFFGEIEIGRIDNATSNFKKNFNSHLGPVFERVLTELVIENENLRPFEPTRTGRWWYKDKEIDIIALNENTGEILFCECKWQDKVDAKRIFEELKEKAKHVQWNNDERKEYYAIFSRSFRKRIKEPELFLWDLEDIEKASVTQT